MGFDDLIRQAQLQGDPNNPQNGGNPLFQPSVNDSERIRALKEKLNKKYEGRKSLMEERKRISDMQNSAQQTARNYVQPTPQVQSAEDYTLNTLGDEQNIQARQLGAVTGGSGSADMVQMDKFNQGTDFNVDRVYMDSVAKFSENFMVGLGNMIGDYGDIAQMVGAAVGINSLAEGNFLSRALQQSGNEMTAENATYIPPELQDPKFSISTIMNPDFWMIHGAQFTPQIMEILATIGAGAAVERASAYGLEKGLTKYFAKELSETAAKKGAREAAQGIAMESGEQAVKNIAKDAAEAGLVGTVVNTTARGAGAIEELTAGARGAGRLLRDTGKLSNAGRTVAQATGNIAGGVLTNMRVSLSNAGEVYNTYAGMKNSDGSPMFTQEELAQMASSTFSNNMKYMGMDILSWSMTYGGGRNLLANAASGLKNTLTEAAQRKVSGALLSKAISPAMKKSLEFAMEKGVQFANKGKGFAKWATIGAMEGLEESIQEVHEEWSKMKGYEEGAGSLVNFQGKGKKYTDSFWDFYTSKEMEGTRTIAGILGAAAGGMFNLKELINKSAEDAHQMNTRAQLLKDVIKSGTQRHEMQQYQIESSIREQVFQGKEAYSGAFINDLLERGIIDEQKANDLASLVDIAVENREKTNLLNMNGKKAYFTSLMQERTFNTLIADANDKFKIRVAELDEQFSNLSPEEKEINSDYQAALKKLQNGNEATIGSLQEQINIAQENKRNLLLGKPAKPIKLNSGVYDGNIFYYNDYQAESDESLEGNPEIENQEREFTDDDSEVQRAKKTFKGWIEQGVKKGKELVNKGVNAFNKLKGDTANPEENIQEDPEENTGETANYKKASKELSEMTDEDIESRADELIAERQRLEQEMQNKTSEEQQSYINAINEIDSEFDQLTNQAGKDVDENDDVSNNNEPEAVPEVSSEPEEKTSFNKGDEVMYNGKKYTIGDVGTYPDQNRKGRKNYHLIDENGKEMRTGGIRKYVDEADISAISPEESSDVTDEDIENYINQRENPEPREKTDPENKSKKPSKKESEILDIGHFGSGNGDDVGFYDSNEKLYSDYGTADSNAVKNYKEYKGYKINVKNQNGKKLVTIHFGQYNPNSDREGGHAGIAIEVPASVSVDSDFIDRLLPVIEKYKNDNYADIKNDGRLRPIRPFNEFIAPDLSLFINDDPNNNPDDDISGNLIDDNDIRESRRTVTMNLDEEPDPEASERNKISQTVSAAVTGTRKGLNNLLQRGKSFGMRMYKNSGERAKMKYYQMMMIDSEKFGHQFITRMNEVNNSGLWNGREKPNLYFVHSMNVINGNIDPETPGIYIPSINAIFMKQNAWDDDMTYHHEFLHFNYSYMADTDEMEEYLRNIRNRYPNLVEQVRQDYWDKILVSVPRHIAEGKTNEEVSEMVNEIRDLLRNSGIQESDIDRTVNEVLNSDPVVLNKGQLFDLYPDMSEDLYDSMNKNFQISELPAADQLIINEELFTHSQESARSKKYNMFFEERPPVQERKTFWQKMQKRVDKVFPTQRDKENNILDALDVPNFTQFTDINSALWSSFEQRFPSGTFDQETRERRINGLKKQYAAEAETIKSEINLLSEISETEFIPVENNEEQIDNQEIEYTDQEIINPTSETLESEEEISSEDLETLSTDTIADSYFDNSKNASERAIGKIISGTIANINRRINEAYAKKISENNGEYVSPPLFDTAALQQEMFDRAKDSSDVVDFILQMRKSEIPEVQLMIKSLKKGQRQNSEVSVLKAFYQINKNKHSLSPVITTINPNGTISIEDAKTSMMKSKAQQIYKDLEETAFSEKKSKNALKFDQFVQDMEHLRTTPEVDIDNDAVVRVLQFFGDRSVDYDRIMEHGFLTVKGQEYPIIKMLKDVARNSVKGKFTYDSRTRTYTAFNPDVHSMQSGTKYDVYGMRPRTDNIDRSRYSKDPRKSSAGILPLNPYYRPLINAVLATDAKFKDSKSYRNAEGNLTGARMANNAVLSIFERMSNDILTNLQAGNKYSKLKFISSYGNISKDQAGRGKFSNALLSHIYDTVVRTGNPYQVVPSFGIENNQTGTGKILKNQNPDEDSLDQLIMYDQRKKFKNYFMDLGRFSSSSQRFLINVPIQENMYSKGTMLLKKTPEAVNAFNIFKNQSENPDLTFEKFASDLQKMLNNEITYLENYRREINPETLRGIDMLKSQNQESLTALTESQKNDIADYFYNQFLNGLYSNEIIFPGFKFAKNDLIKRSASGSTTFTPLGDNVGHEIIYFHDGSEGDIDTDGAAYILREDFDRIKNTAGKFMPINGHVKMAHVGIEYDGPAGMQGVTQYDKPLYIAIDENYVKQNPKLKGLYDLMKARKAKWEEQYGTGSADYADGSSNHMITAVSMSAEKSKNPLKKEWAVNINEIDETSLFEHSNKMDGIYYPDNSFKGFSGQNIGVQIVMNNNVDRSVVPSQLISFITTGGGLFADMDMLNQAQQHIFNEMQTNLQDLENVVNTGSISDLTEFVKNRGFFDEEKMDQIARMLLFDENMSLATPQARELVLNTLKQYIIKAGNRLSTPGTQARVVPSFGYSKKFTINGQDYEIEELHNSMGETSAGEYLPTYAKFGPGLQDYKKTTQKVNDQWVSTYQPAEMVAPANLARQGVRKRQYFLSWDGNTSQNSSSYRKAVAFAKQNGLNENDVKSFRIKNKKDLEASFGFYVPGEVVMATRIPSHGPQSTGFFEVVDFETTGTSQVQVPPGFTSVTGQDHDGDALFINIKDKNNKESEWNKAFNLLQDHWLSPAMQENEVNQKLTFEENADQAIEYLKEKLPSVVNTSAFQSTEYLHTPEGRRNQFSNTLISKANIGSVMSLHRTYSILSNYSAEFRTPIQIGDKYNITGFGDFITTDNNGNQVSRTILSANIANMILDDVKNGLSSKLGINSNTIKYVMPLVNMGVDLGDIAVIMNSDLMKQWNQMNEFNNNIFTFDEYLNPDILSNQNKMALLGRENAMKKITGNIDFDNINSLESKQGIINLIADLSSIQNDMHKMNTVIRGHNEMETNSFIGQKELLDFDNFMNNQTQTKTGIQDNFLLVGDDLRNSPLMKNYRKNAELMVRVAEKTDIVFSDKGRAVWNSAVTGNPRNINDEKQRNFHNALEKFTIAQYLGLAGSEVKQHVADLLRPNTIENPNNKNIFNRLAAYMARPVNPEEQANPNRKTFGATNILFQHALITNLYGNNDSKFIRLNGVIADEDTSQAMRDVAKSEFANLPSDLQRDLAIYDLVKNGFNGKNSLFPLFSPELKDQIKTVLDQALMDKKNQMMGINAHAEMMANFMGNNANEYLLKTNNLILNAGGSMRINTAALKNNSQAWNAIQNSVNNGSVVYFTDAYRSNPNSSQVTNNVYVIRPYTNKDMQEYNEIKTGARTLQDFGMNNISGQTDAEFFLTEKLAGKISQVNFDEVNPEVSQVIMSKSGNNRIGFFEDLNVRERRIRSESYYKYENKMSRGEFDNVMNFPVNFSDDQKANLYSEYEVDYINGIQKNAEYSDEKLIKMSNEQLQNLYSGNPGAEDIRNRGVGYQNKFAYAKIINRVTREIANRAAAEQADLIRKNNPGINYEVPAQSKDLGVMQSWLISSNIPSDNPALQAAIRNIKVAEKSFKNEKAKYMRRLNDVTSELYKEKFGYDPYSGFKGKAKHILNKARNFFSQGDAMKNLYGNLIKEELIQQEDGTTIKNMRYHDPEVMAQKLSSGEISQVEYNFYKETSDMMKEFEQFAVKSPRGTRQGYIPHVAPSMMEAYSRKGLLGVMANLKDVDEQLGDVVLNYNGKPVAYNDVVADFIKKYNQPDYQKQSSGKLAAELFKLKTKAIKLLKKGTNEDGTPIRYSNIQIGSTIGDVFMNEFSGERGVKASDMPSWDLNKAFSDYFHGVLFNNGNSNFSGFRSMLPLFDGIISKAYEGNNQNTINYVDRVWRQYFLQGAKQHHTKTPAELKALGVTTDNVIDFITKGSLFYWLGYKGLAIGNGAYAIGNILAGKYNHIKDLGGKSWATGEKRFWKGTESFNIADPLRGLKQSLAVMKKAGFMDINIYDDVSLNEGNSFSSFLGDIALMPMTWSEKWIQGVQFLGQLTEGEYQSLANDENYQLPQARLNQIESNVTLSQGRGYQPTDQRMVQMYSYGRMATQFSRWIPTAIHNLFAKEDYDIYGQKFIGSYRAFGKVVSRFATGEISPAKFAEYRNSLTPAERQRLDSAFRGFGLMTLAAGGVALGFNQADKLLSDVNIFADIDRMSNKLVPPAVSMSMNLAGM